ncbi:MAG TPA: hypothetical protein VG308_18460 [Stellaceae bacterium]|nr:hypothetical protein [Stellaceae bacterium]
MAGRPSRQLLDLFPDACFGRAQLEYLLQVEHNSALVPNQWPSRKAVSSVMPRWPLTIPVIRFTGSSIWHASSAAGNAEFF